jgi:hypothetical protein
MNRQHLPGAIRAAEALTGGKYGDAKLYKTAYGRKTVMGIADLIELDTGLRALYEGAVYMALHLEHRSSLKERMDLLTADERKRLTDGIAAVEFDGN